MLPPVVKNLFLSKKWLTAFLTAVAATAAYFGTNLNVEAILLFISPLMIYIGAQGWADSGKEKALIEQQTETMKAQTALKMHEMSLAAAKAPPAAMLASDTPKAPDLVKSSTQAGFVSFKLMSLFTLLGVVVMSIVIAACLGKGGGTTPGSGSGSDAGSGQSLSQCAQQDLQQMIGDTSLLATVAVDLAQQNWADLLKTLIAKVGGDAVGCAVLYVDTIGHASTPKGAEPTPITMHADMAMKQFGWDKLAPGGSK